LPKKTVEQTAEIASEKSRISAETKAVTPSGLPDQASLYYRNTNPKRNEKTNMKLPGPVIFFGFVILAVVIYVCMYFYAVSHVLPPAS
jgi:hypothetical protein